MLFTTMLLSVTERKAFLGGIFRNSRTNQQMRDGFYYRVQKGDTLWALSQRYNVSVERLRKVNNLKDNILPIKTIYIPRGPSTTHLAPSPKTDKPHQTKTTVAKTENSNRKTNKSNQSTNKNNQSTNKNKTENNNPDTNKSKTENNNPDTNKSKTTEVKTNFIWPVQKPQLASGGNFGLRSNGTTNTGIQLAVEANAPVYAAGQGKLVYAAALKGYGNTIIIDHENNYFTVYSHLARIQPLKAGDSIKSKQLIGHAGMSGNTVTPILHFELRYLNEAKNPLLYLDTKALK